MTPPNVLRTADQPFISSGTVPPPFSDGTIELWPLGLKTLGACIREIPPGARTGPLHAHMFEEEVFYVLDGTVTVRELEPGADDYREFSLHAGEVAVYPAGTGLAHCSFNRSDAPAVLLGLSDNQPGEVCVYPDSGKTLLRSLKRIGVHGEEGLQALGTARAAAAARSVRRLADGARPPHVLASSALDERDCGTLFGRQLSRSAGAQRVFVNLDRLPPTGQTSPAHWHSVDEELVLVVSGSPTLRQLRGQPGDGAPDFAEAAVERCVLQPRDVVHFGPGHPLAHQVLNESDEDALLLVIGTDDPQDLTVFPERDRIYVKALGTSAPFQRASYWDGET
jgi:uncharacterized cupin superfamily protein